MNARINHQQLLRFAGLFTWGMVGIPLLYAGWQGFDHLSREGKPAFLDLEDE